MHTPHPDTRFAASPASSSAAAVIFTIGHSTRPVDELIDLLRGNGVDLLVDVRRFPGSRRYPQYNAEPFARTLRAAGIDYRHAPELGGRRRGEDSPMGDAAPSPNAGWRNASFRAYADYMGTKSFAEALARLEGEGREGTVAILCAEAVPWRCHRNLISDALVARGWEVRHITSSAEPRPHELNPMARVDEAGRVTYPGDAPDQGELF